MAYRHLAQEGLVAFMVAGRELPDLNIDLVAQRLGERHPLGLGRILETFDQPDRCPPQRARLRQLGSDLMQFVYGMAHLLEPPRLIADPCEQAALEARALAQEIGAQFPFR